MSWVFRGGTGAPKIRGVQLAIVVDNKDGGDNPGYRVKLKYPWLSEAEASFWARIAVPMGGAGRGTYMLPEIDDQVLVVFEHGDIHRPIVIGGVWNHKQAPVEVNQSGQNNTKLIKSRTGHRIIFDDKAGAEKITIVDKTKQNKIVFDSAHKVVKIESAGDIEVIAKANVILHANALKVGATDSVTGKAQSLLVHAQKTFGLKATSGITVSGGSTVINVSNAAATRVSGAGTGELAGIAAEPAKQSGGSEAGGGAAGGSNGGQGAAPGTQQAVPPGPRLDTTPVKTVYVLDMEDVHFHLDSAVLLPEGADSDANNVTGIAALRSILLEVKDHPARKLFIAGHTDSLGSGGYNQTLSERRARSVYTALTGDKAGWARVAESHHKPRDIKRILRWAADNWGWDCDPGPIDDAADAQGAIKKFKLAYNDEYTPALPVTEAVDHATWEAFFTLYMDDLGEMVRPDGGLETLRGKLSWFGGKLQGFGERYPREDLGDEENSEANRRVEVLFFDPGEEPGAVDEVYRAGTLYTQSPISPRPMPAAAEGRARLAEIKGLYKPGVADGGKAAGYQAGYKSQDDAGRIFINTVPHEPGQDWQASWKKDRQFIEITVEIDAFPASAVLPHRLKVAISWEDPDDPSNDEMRPEMGKRVDPNDYDADGALIGAAPDDNRGRVDFPARNVSDKPKFEGIDPYRLKETGTASCEVAVHEGKAKVRLHCPNAAGDNLKLACTLLPRPHFKPLGGDQTGVMTLWKRIDVEYRKMPTALPLPLDEVKKVYEKMFVQMDVDGPHPISDRLFLGNNEHLADQRAEALVQGKPNGVFEHARRPGWFLAVAANQFDKELANAESIEIYDGPATVVDDGGGQAILLPVAVDRFDVRSVSVEDGDKSVLFFAGSPTVNRAAKTTKIPLHGIDFQPTWTVESDGSIDAAYSVTDNYYPAKGILHDASVNDGYKFGTDIQVTVYAGSATVSGISPSIAHAGKEYFAGKTIVFTQHAVNNRGASTEVTVTGTFTAGEVVSLALAGEIATYTIVAGDDARAAARGITAAVRAHAALNARLQLVRRNGTIMRVRSRRRGTDDNGLELKVTTTSTTGDITADPSLLAKGGADNDEMTTTLVHELGHAFGFPHKCGYRTWEPEEERSCAMNYFHTFLYEDMDHPEHGVRHMVTGKESRHFCGKHVESVRRVHLEDNPALWTW